MEKTISVAGPAAACNQSAIFSELIKILDFNYKKLLEGDYINLLNFYRARSSIIGKYVAVYTDPMNGNPEKYAEGKVNAIGDNLELLIEGISNPITKGRVLLVQ